MDSETEAGDPFLLQTIKVEEKEENSSKATVGDKGQEKNWRGDERRRCCPAVWKLTKTGCNKQYSNG